MSEEYEVEDIIGKRLNQKGLTQYLIKWEGYPVDESTWEPAENLHKIKSLIRIYEENIKKKNSEDNQAIAKQATNTNSSGERKYYEVMDSLGPLVPSLVVTVRLIDKILHCLVEFLQIEDTRIPNAYVPSSVIKETYPKILIDFYEKKIRFIPVMAKNSI